VKGADYEPVVLGLFIGDAENDFRPVGLYIENGRELTPANTTTLAGAPSQIPNFYKKPNGVFYIGRGEAGILETGHFLNERPNAKFATQSGPMLVIDGEIHPAFIVGSTDRKPRNGVGVSSQTRVHFVISKGRVNFHEFAHFFREGLGCNNALFLDGDHEQHGLAANVLDHQGLTLMAAERVGSLKPYHLQLVDVLGVDIRQGAVTRQSKIPTRGWPLIGILYSGQLLLIGIGRFGRARQTHQESDEPAGQQPACEFQTE
jgi:hypothetical protein